MQYKTSHHPSLQQVQALDVMRISSMISGRWSQEGFALEHCTERVTSVRYDMFGKFTSCGTGERPRQVSKDKVGQGWNVLLDLLISAEKCGMVQQRVLLPPKVSCHILLNFT